VNDELLKKLRYKKGLAQVWNAPDGYSLGIESADDSDGKYAFVQLFVWDLEEVMLSLPKLFESLEEDAVCWITYPKQRSSIKTDINRDILANFISEKTDYRVVSNISIDDTWSALRLREKNKVKSKS